MGLLLLLHLVVGFAVIATGEQLGRRALPIAALPSLCSIVWLATALPEVLDGGVAVGGLQQGQIDGFLPDGHGVSTSRATQRGHKLLIVPMSVGRRAQSRPPAHGGRSPCQAMNLPLAPITPRSRKREPT